MRPTEQATTSKTESAMRTTVRRRWAMPAATALIALAGAGTLAGSASANNPGFDFEPGEVSVKALDAADNEVTQAGAHPDRLRIQFGVTRDTVGVGPRAAVNPRELVKDLEITLPEGIQGNPRATAKCSLARVGSAQPCPADSQVGRHVLLLRSNRGTAVEEVTNLYNVEPPEGVVARFAMRLVGIVTVTLDMKVKSDGSYQIVTSARSLGQAVQLIRSTTEIWGVPAAKTGLGAQVPLLTLGSQCGVELPATFRANAWRHPSQWIEANALMPALTGCDRLQFKPSLDLRPTSDVADAPSGYRFQLQVPQNPAPDSPGTPPLKRAEVLFPEGAAISPGGANGLGSCSNEQAQIGVDATPHCPSDARIGSVEIDTPVMDVPLKGGVFIGTPKSQDAQTGEMFRIFLLASAKGVDIKQEGKMFPDPVTGRLRAVFENAPQQPFETMTIDLDGGPGAALVNPATCGTKTTTATMTSWGGQTATSDSSFEIACRPGLGLFAPSFTGGVLSPQAGISSPFALSIGKPDGQSVLNGLSMSLPKGLLANLKGNVGQQVGTATTLAGSGAAPFQLAGKVFLEGPYGDAPFSLRVVVPAKAGPFDLGEVVVRQKLYVDPDDAHVTVVSDPIPTILQGVPTRIQRLDVSVDKPGFMINPTSCEASSIGGSLSSSTGQTSPISTRFQVGSCGDLAYAPKLALALGGDAKELKNGGHPQLSATLMTAKGEANQKKVAVTLPLNLALDPDNAKALCEPAAVASNSCPAESIVGSAKAVSILDVPLEGPVYFVRGERTTAAGKIAKTLPKLFIPLSGQGVRINVHASSDVVDRKLQTTFDNLPDAPIEAFDLKLNGGANGILKVTNGDVCRSTSTPTVGQRLVGHNGRVFRGSSVLTAGCPTAVVRAVRSGVKLRVTVGGVSRGSVSVSGRGITKSSLSVRGSATVATLNASLSTASRRALASGRSVRVKLTATVKPAGKKAVKVTKTVTLKTAKKAAKQAKKAAAKH